MLAKQELTSSLQTCSRTESIAGYLGLPPVSEFHLLQCFDPYGRVAYFHPFILPIPTILGFIVSTSCFHYVAFLAVATVTPPLKIMLKSGSPSLSGTVVPKG